VIGSVILDAQGALVSRANGNIPNPHRQAKTKREERSIKLTSGSSQDRGSWLTRSTSSVVGNHKRDEYGCLSTLIHIRVLFAFSVVRKLLVRV
jgi:hypothetical protein